MPAASIITVALFGLLVGSFLNVVIARVPAKEPQDRSLGGRSRCPKCGAAIRWYDNVPLISYALLVGRCRDCRERIAIRYPLVEAITSALWVAVLLASDSTGELVRGLVLVSLLVPITFIDLDHRIIPNVLSVPGALTGIALGIAFQPSRWLEFGVSALGAATFLLAAALIKPGGMGMGDVKLALLMGAFLGAPVVIGMFAGFLLGAVPSIALLAVHGSKARKMAIPFGPFLAGGTLVGWLWGQQLLDWYLSTIRH